MKTQTINRTREFTQQTDKRLNFETLKFTALSYLTEARHNEDYEQMGEIITYAREFGAGPDEISAILK